MVSDADPSELSENQLWDLNDATARSDRGTASLLDVKAELARRAMSSCCLCERRCGVDRLGGATGFCGVGAESYYFFEQVLSGEEPPLIPSHEVFFSGCNLRCSFCYSHEALLDPQRGTAGKPDELAHLIDSRRAEGAANLNVIGGEPTIHLASLLETLKLLTNPTPLVWNSNFYMSAETMRLLADVVDLYLGDFRFGNNRCASQLAGAGDYVEVAQRNFVVAASQGDLIIRHLILPGHVECCFRPIAEWTAEHLPGVPFNLMFQYTPFFRALDDPALCRSISTDEEAEAKRVAKSLGLNTTAWKRPLTRRKPGNRIGKGEITTSITIRPDGRIGIMHLHGELLDVVRSLTEGGATDG